MPNDAAGPSKNGPEEKARRDAAAFIVEQLGEEWLTKPPEEIKAALRETDWWKRQQDVIDEWNREGEVQLRRLHGA